MNQWTLNQQDLEEIQDDLEYACTDGDLATVNRLLADHPTTIDPTTIDLHKIINHRGGRVFIYASPFEMACRGGHLAVVERLLQDQRVNPADNNNNAIRMASGCGRVLVVDRLLQDERVDPAAGDNSAIHSAAINNHSSVVERLLQDERVDPKALHDGKPAYRGLNYPETILTNAMLPPLAAALTLPFPANSPIILWQPRLRQYFQQMQLQMQLQIQLLKDLIAAWQDPRSGVSYEIVEDVVAEYVLGRRLQLVDEYVAAEPEVGQEVAVDHQLFRELIATRVELDAVRRELWDVKAELQTMKEANHTALQQPEEP
jgi:hypothetical protein